MSGFGDDRRAGGMKKITQMTHFSNPAGNFVVLAQPIS
jgi:hypothetical protein